MYNFVNNNQQLIKSDKYESKTIEQCIEWLLTLEEVAIDTETEGLFDHKNKVIMLQLSDGEQGWAIDTRNNSYLGMVMTVILANKIKLIAQNFKFDYKFLKKAGYTTRQVFDTFLAECILTNGMKDRQLSLDALAIKYTDYILDKSTRNQFLGLNGKPFTDNQIIYGLKDVMCLPEIKRRQIEELNKLDLMPITELENAVTLALGDIEYNGLKIDREKWKALAKVKAAKIPQHEKELDDMVLAEPKLKKFWKKYTQVSMFEVEERKVSVSWSSPAQVLPLFKELGLPLTSSSEKEINIYQNDFPLVKKFIDYRKDLKLVSTYGENFLDYVNSTTGRVHTDIWQIVETHRVSSNNPNLQNLPASNEYLNCFIAADGFDIIGIDYAAQEARIAAAKSKDEVWMATFIEGKDLHSEVCKMMFHITDDLVRTKPAFLRGKSYRDAAKTINFGVLFGMSKFKLSKSLSISVEEADGLIKTYFEATKGLKKFLDTMSAYGIKNGYIRSFKPYSIIRYFPEWREGLNRFIDFKTYGEIERACYNTPVQGTGATMTKRALVKIREFILDNNLSELVFLIHVVHDATYTECKTEISEWFSKEQARLMIEAGEEFDLGIPILTDITIEKFWTK